jgi:hypothetical protein
MNPFTKLLEFPFVICNICCFAYIAKKIEPHLKKHHKGIGATVIRKIAKQVQDIPGIIVNERELLT